MRRTSVEVKKLAALPARIPFEKIARKTLLRGYRLSLVICADLLARKMNRTYRKKRYAANVLSFPLAPREGEIFLNVRAAAREAKEYKISLRERLILLFVHGCLHLKGMKHGEKMERIEKRMVSQFS